VEAMTPENVELVHRALEAFDRRDMDAYLALMADDVEAESRLASVEGGFRGHDGIRRWWDNMFVVWPDVRAKVVEAEGHGDLTLIRLDLRGHGAGSDVPLEWTVWQVAKWQGGKCVRWTSFSTRAEALEAAGIEE
jgi:ketosteroid isomerase-like protein